MYDQKSYNKWYKNNRDKKVKNVREAFLNLRLKTLEILGNQCTRCGYEEDKRILMVDHKNDNGSAERKQNGQGWKYRKQILEKIIAGSKEYQLLCPNCSAVKEADRHIKNLNARLVDWHNKSLPTIREGSNSPISLQ